MSIAEYLHIRHLAEDGLACDTIIINREKKIGELKSVIIGKDGQIVVLGETIQKQKTKLSKVEKRKEIWRGVALGSLFVAILEAMYLAIVVF